jgi:hypothetical protein
MRYYDLSRLDFGDHSASQGNVTESLNKPNLARSRPGNAVPKDMAMAYVGGGQHLGTQEATVPMEETMNEPGIES